MRRTALSSGSRTLLRRHAHSFDLRILQHAGAGSGDRPKRQGEIVFSENYAAATLAYVISTPIQNGGAWSLWYSSGGVSLAEVNAGTYQLGPPSARSGSKSTTANVRTVIAKLKGEKQ